MKALTRKSLLAVACAALTVAALPAPAHAWGRVGVFVGISPFPLFYPAPGYEYAPPPPPPYAPPPYAPYAPYAAPRPVGFTCYARPYECPLDHPKRLGKPCACIALNGGAIPGTVVQ